MENRYSIIRVWIACYLSVEITRFHIHERKICGLDAIRKVISSKALR
jgi:hypothetical protein